MSYQDKIDQDFRLVILRALSEQVDYTLNEAVLADIASKFGHNPSRTYTRNQLLWLQDAGAVTVQQAGSVMVATLTERGRDHVELRATIDGVNRPSPPRS